ncbi:hypothetical protein [Azospirillum sp. B510]|nr:hypothetical protein [Azospirillum sp. B510]
MSLQEDIATGLEDAAAGRTTDGELLFERLISKYAISKHDKTGQSEQG